MRIPSWPLWVRLHAWLSPADVPRAADLIFVLAGKMERKDYALALLDQGLAPRVLFSVGRFEIRRFSKMALPVPLDLLKMAQGVPPPQRHYFVFFDGQTVQVEHVPPGRFGTLTEIRALSYWLARHPEIRSLLIISNDTHLRRIRLCCRALLDSRLELAYVAVPPCTPLPSPAALPNHTYAAEDNRRDDIPPILSPSAFKEDVRELLKVMWYWVWLKLH